MRHRKKKFSAGNNSGHNNLLQRNLATSLVLHNKIKTTYKNAKLTQPLIEKVITIGKVKNLNSKRKIHDLIKSKEAEKKIVSELSDKYKERNGGYTRILKLGRRKGDNALIVQIEFV